MKHILVIRLSAMGDVAMAVPVIKLLLNQNPGIRITFLSAAFLQSLFTDIDRCTFYPADIKGKHKTASGIFHLFLELRKQRFDAVADLHNVLRTNLLTTLFRLLGCSVGIIDKGRGEKRLLTRKTGKVLTQLKSTHQRYAEVFKSLGLEIDLTTGIEKSTEKMPGKTTTLIGIAPFAQHRQKMYPLNRMRKVVEILSQQGLEIFLFGAKGIEAAALERWETISPKVKNIAGKFSFEKELEIISGLSLMVSMDSANMHLASLYGIPVISVWGATHRFAGFYGWQQSIENIVETDLYCRPCSVFGNVPCYRGDHACMEMIEPETIAQKILGFLRWEMQP